MADTRHQYDWFSSTIEYTIERCVDYYNDLVQKKLAEPNEMVKKNNNNKTENKKTNQNNNNNSNTNTRTNNNNNNNLNNQRNSTSNNNNNNNNNNNTTTNPRNPTQRDDQAISAFKQQIASSNDPCSVILKMLANHHNTCPFHPNTTRHNFIQCYALSSLCAQLCILPICQVIRSENNVNLPNDRVVQNFERYNNNNNPPASAPAPAAARQAAVTNPPAPARQTSMNNQIEQRAAEMMAEQMARMNAMQDDDSNTSSNNNNNTGYPYLRNCSSTPDSTSTPLFTMRCKSAPFTNQQSSTPHQSITTVIDSGAGGDMTSHESLFQSINYYYTNTPTAETPTVVMGDDQTTHFIKGHGVMDYIINGKRIKKYGFLVPNLGDVMLLSVKDHSSYKGCYFYSGNDTTVLAFPSFVLTCDIHPEIQLTVTPTTTPTDMPVSFDYFNGTTYCRKAICPSITTSNISTSIINKSRIPTSNRIKAKEWNHCQSQNVTSPG